jgi:hypothetical protein
VVEGDAEYASLPRLHTQHLIGNCPPLRATNLAGVGSHLSPEGIAKRVVPKVIAHKVAGRNRVVLCIDREDRAECAGELAQAVNTALLKELQRRNADTADVHTVIADRAFEAWLLADTESFAEAGIFKREAAFSAFEGQHGKRGRKGTVELTELLGRQYDKKVDGPRLFTKLDFSKARTFRHGGRGSRSLDKLLRTLGV